MSFKTKAAGLVAATALAFSLGAPALADTTSDTTVSVTVSDGTFGVLVTAGSFEEIQAGETSSTGSFTVSVEDSRAAGNDWNVDASIAGFVGSESSHTFTGNLALANGESDPVVTTVSNPTLAGGADASTQGAAQSILTQSNSPGGGADWEAGWDATVTGIPTNIASDTYTANLQVTISGADL